MTGQELKKKIVENGVEMWRVAKVIGHTPEWLTRIFRLEKVPENKLIIVLTALPQAIADKKEFERQHPRNKKKELT